MNARPAWFFRRETSTGCPGRLMVARFVLLVRWRARLSRRLIPPLDGPTRPTARPGPPTPAAVMARFLLYKQQTDPAVLGGRGTPAAVMARFLLYTT
ncbi:MAG TPA: hypothetical protein VFZ66_09870 [Herpetosiphonaceae bacterium]